MYASTRSTAGSNFRSFLATPGQVSPSVYLSPCLRVTDVCSDLLIQSDATSSKYPEFPQMRRVSSPFMDSLSWVDASLFDSITLGPDVKPQSCTSRSTKGCFAENTAANCSFQRRS